MSAALNLVPPLMHAGLEGSNMYITPGTATVPLNSRVGKHLPPPLPTHTHIRLPIHAKVSVRPTTKKHKNFPAHHAKAMQQVQATITTPWPVQAEVTRASGHI